MKNILIIPLVLLVTACAPEPITQVDLSNYIQITKIINDKGVLLIETDLCAMTSTIKLIN